MLQLGKYSRELISLRLPRNMVAFVWNCQKIRRSIFLELIMGNVLIKKLPGRGLAPFIPYGVCSYTDIQCIIITSRPRFTVLIILASPHQGPLQSLPPTHIYTGFLQSCVLVTKCCKVITECCFIFRNQAQLFISTFFEEIFSSIVDI